jgi:hypothetical protein
MIRKSALALMLGLSLTAAAQESPATAAADFTAGFERLIALGLPELKGAEWVAAGDESRNPDYSLREILQELKGNGWKIQQGEKPMFVPLGQLDPQEMPATSGSGRGLLGGLLGGGSKKAKTVDPVKDAAKLIATLADPEKSKDFRSRLEYSGASSLGSLLIHATQLHQTGHPKEASQLVSTILSLGANPETVIDAAINQLAARDQSRITEAFFTTHDWAAYERDLRALAERYPRGWENFPAVQMLLPAVAKRVAGEMPANPAIPGITLHPEAIAALEATLQENKNSSDDDAVARFAKERKIPEAQLTPQMRQQIARMLSRSDGEYSSGPWLVAEPPGKESKDPWLRLKSLGLDALPALAAIANDDTLTFSRNGSSRSSYSYRSNQETAADRALKAYQSMDRPQTRGELACSLLTATLPGMAETESSPQMIADAAMEFWKANRGKSKLDLLLLFLAEGNAQEKQIASTALAEIPEEAAHQAFEKYVLEGDGLTDSLDSVATYLKRRKTAAKDFFTRFSAALKSQLDGVDLDSVSGGYEIKQAGGVDKYLKKLSLLVGRESPRKLLLELAKAEKPDTRQINSLAETLAESSPETFVPLYLEAAASATHSKTRAAFLAALIHQAYDQESDNKEEMKETPVPPAQIPHWITLLGDDRTTPNGDQIRLHAAQVLEQYHSPATWERISEIYKIDPGAYNELVLARANSRLAGKSPIPLPDATKVSATRMAEMLKQLADAKPEAIHGLANAWPIEDRLAFKNWQEDPKQAATLPANVTAARKLLTAPVESPDDPPVAQTKEIMRALKLEPGTKIDFDTVTKLAATIASETKTHSGLCLGLSEFPLGTGMTITADRAFSANSKFSNGYAHYLLSHAVSALNAPKTTAAVTLHCSSRTGRDMPVIWTHDGTKIIPPDASTLEKFRETMTADDQNSSTVSIHLSVLHRDDLEKLAKLNRSGDSEDSDSSDEDSSSIPMLPPPP